jgi:23S rRNA (uracil1939-C5)-methyltransferase
MAAENYERLARILYPELEIVSDTEKFYHYRNKIEYSFALNDKNQLSFGFSERGGWDKVAITGCTLASPAITEVTEHLLDWLRQTTLSVTTLKSLILRSNSRGEVAAALFINQKITFPSTPKLDDHLRGFQIYFTDHRCPASRPDELLFSDGQNYLTEKINDIELKFGLLSFFQINPPLFEQALRDIEPWLDNNSSVVDYFSGVGAVSLTLHHKIKEAKLIEVNREAVDYAAENIKFNKLANFSAILSPAEKAVDYITSDQTIIFDPPRAGLGPTIIRKLHESEPPRIIYLSCDPATHARDIMSLSPLYEVKFLKLYNFFPRTPHIESLAILELKK